MLWKTAIHFQDQEHNYCRTPPGDTDNDGGPWCYTATSSWDRCNVPVCGGKYNRFDIEMRIDGIGEGVTYQLVKVDVIFTISQHHLVQL